jgi:hypothetical protein
MAGRRCRAREPPAAGGRGVRGRRSPPDTTPGGACDRRDRLRLCARGVTAAASRLARRVRRRPGAGVACTACPLAALSGGPQASPLAGDAGPERRRRRRARRRQAPRGAQAGGELTRASACPRRRSPRRAPQALREAGRRRRRLCAAVNDAAPRTPPAGGDVIRTRLLNLPATKQDKVLLTLLPHAWPSHAAAHQLTETPCTSTRTVQDHHESELQTQPHAPARQVVAVHRAVGSAAM